MSYSIKDFNGLFTEDEFNNLSSRVEGYTNPIDYLVSNCFDSSGCFGALQYNTFSAIRLISQSNPEWLRSKGEQIVKEKEPENVSGILGEVRCYGLLLNTFAKEEIQPVKCTPGIKTPDFKIIKNSQIVNVEINTPQINKSEKDKIISSNQIKKDPNCNVCIKEISICPYGRKKGTITKNVISKLTSVKSGSEQFERKNPNILLIDLQSEYLDSIDDRLNTSFPVFSSRSVSGTDGEGIYSNEIWYSLYSKKETPVFDGNTFDDKDGHNVSLSKMEHNGMFNIDKNKFIGAVIVSTPQHVAIFENPRAFKKIPIWFLEKVAVVPRFAIQSSKTRLLDRRYAKSIKNELKIIKKLSKKDFYSW